MAVPSEWRIDSLTGRRVLIAPARGERPAAVKGCPFCEGNEHETTPEVLAIRDANTLPNQPGWRVRVIPNRYAAVQFYTDPAPDLAHGVAEIFVEGSHHATRFEQLPLATLFESVHCWRARSRVWATDGRLAFAQVFKNQGSFAGASLDHCHSQLIGVQIIPDTVRHELTALAAHRVQTSRCLVCDMLLSERTSARFITETLHFCAFAPRAGRFPGEVWLVPKAHAAHFDTLIDEQLADLAPLMQRVLQAQVRTFDAPNYNIVVKSAPFRTDAEGYHWRVELLPRTTGIAGWEWGTGVLINTMTPEDAAQRLRAELSSTKPKPPPANERE